MVLSMFGDAIGRSANKTRDPKRDTPSIKHITKDIPLPAVKIPTGESKHRSKLTTLR